MRNQSRSQYFTIHKDKRSCKWNSKCPENVSQRNRERLDIHVLQQSVENAETLGVARSGPQQSPSTNRIRTRLKSKVELRRDLESGDESDDAEQSWLGKPEQIRTPPQASRRKRRGKPLSRKKQRRKSRRKSRRLHSKKQVHAPRPCVTGVNSSLPFYSHDLPPGSMLVKT